MEYYVENPTSDDHMHCYKIGMWRDYENGRDVYGTFDTTLQTLGESLPFEWHESLAYSAAKSLKEVQMCSIEAEFANFPQDQHFFFNEVATARDHSRYIVYPHRMKWFDTQELVYDAAIHDFRRHAEA